MQPGDSGEPRSGVDGGGSVAPGGSAGDEPDAEGGLVVRSAAKATGVVACALHKRLTSLHPRRAYTCKPRPPRMYAEIKL